MDSMGGFVLTPKEHARQKAMAIWMNALAREINFLRQYQGISDEDWAKVSKWCHQAAEADWLNGVHGYDFDDE